MPEILERFPAILKNRMTGRERYLRSQLTQLVSSVGLVRASLNPRDKLCGKPTCRCTRGEKHRSLYLLRSEDAKRRQLFIPRSLESQACEWVEAYQHLRDLVDELSQIYWEKLQRREP